MVSISFMPVGDQGAELLKAGTYKAVLSNIRMVRPEDVKYNLDHQYLELRWDVQPGGDAFFDKLRLWEGDKRKIWSAQKKLKSLYSALKLNVPDIMEGSPIQLDLDAMMGKKLVLVIDTFASGDKAYPFVQEYRSVEDGALGDDVIPF